jgi:hypothetical protein
MTNGTVFTFCTKTSMFYVEKALKMTMKIPFQDRNATTILNMNSKLDVTLAAAKLEAQMRGHTAVPMEQQEWANIL